MSSSASARSLWRISTPLTLATTESFGSAAIVSCLALDELSLEQPATTGRTTSSAATAANASGRDRGAVSVSRFWEVMDDPRVEAAVGGGGQSREIAPLGN